MNLKWHFTTKTNGHLRYLIPHLLSLNDSLLLNQDMVPVIDNQDSIQSQIALPEFPLLFTLDTTDFSQYFLNVIERNRLKQNKLVYYKK